MQWLISFPLDMKNGVCIFKTHTNVGGLGKCHVIPVSEEAEQRVPEHTGY